MVFLGSPFSALGDEVLSCLEKEKEPDQVFFEACERRPLAFPKEKNNEAEVRRRGFFFFHHSK